MTVFSNRGGFIFTTFSDTAFQKIHQERERFSKISFICGILDSEGQIN